MKTVVLDLDEYLSWRSSLVDLRLRLTSGDTSVLTLSENGHDAEAIHLNVGSEIEIPAEIGRGIEKPVIDEKF